MSAQGEYGTFVGAFYSLSDKRSGKNIQLPWASARFALSKLSFEKAPYQPCLQKGVPCYTSHQLGETVSTHLQRSMAGFVSGTDRSRELHVSCLLRELEILQGLLIFVPGNALVVAHDGDVLGEARIEGVVEGRLDRRVEYLCQGVLDPCGDRKSE